MFEASWIFRVRTGLLGTEKSLTSLSTVYLEKRKWQEESHAESVSMEQLSYSWTESVTK
ncbi:MAG: hypothetical protein ACTMH4_01725 [Sphingobacterium sp.]